MGVWDELCSPAKIYAIFMIAFVFFDMYLGSMKRVLRHIAYTVVGTLLLYVLCAANMDFVGWGLILLPVIFYVIFMAILLFDQSFIRFTHEYKPGNGSGSGSGCDPEPSCEADCEPSCSS